MNESTTCLFSETSLEKRYIFKPNSKLSSID